jgi:tetratricopeptide (TPR) repeat protein
MLPSKKRATIITALRTNPNTSLFVKWTGMLPLAGVPYALLSLAVLLAYANVFYNEFLLDDLLLITNNKFLTSWHYIGTLFVTQLFQESGTKTPFYRPLQNLFYMFIYRTAGLAVVAFHLLNITLHAINACLLYTLGTRLGFQRIAVLLAALLWALHPVQTEAVTYMSGTADPLCLAFLLAGILVLVPNFSRRRILTACLLFALALLSKEVAVVFPLLAMGLLFYRSENRWSPKTYLKTWPFWLMAALYFLARETLLNFNGFLNFYNNGVAAEATIWDRFYTFLATLPVYLRLLVWPTGLHMERGFPIYHLVWDGPFYKVFLIPQITAGFAILTTIFYTIVWKPARPATPLAWGILWAGALHIPQSGLLAPSDAILYEHWLYLPTAGLALGLGESLARLSGQIRTDKLQPLLAALAVFIVCLFGVMTFEQNKVWREPALFFTHILKYEPNSARVRTNLGSTYAGNGQYESAIEQYRIALTLSDDAIIHYNLAVVMIQLDHSQPSVTEAVKHFRRTLELDPDYYRADEGIAYVYAHLGDHAREVEYLAKAAAIRKKLGVD